MIATQHKCRCGVPTLYYDELSPQSRSCYMLIKVLDIDVKLQLIDLINGEHLSEAYSKINPSCTVPAWIEGDLILSDGHTILIYLCDTYAGVYLPHLCPRDYLPRLNVLNMLFYEGCVLYRRHMHVLTEILLEKYPNVDLKYHQRKVIDCYNSLNTYLDGQACVVGNCLTIADFSIITTVSGLDLMFPICQDYWPNLHRWVGNLKEMECYKYNEEGIEQMRHLLESVGEFPFPSQLTLEPRAALRSSFQPGVYIDQNNMDTRNLKDDVDQIQPESLMDSEKVENDKDLPQTKQDSLRDSSDKDLSKSNEDVNKDLPQTNEDALRDPSKLDDDKDTIRSDTLLEPSKLDGDNNVPHTEPNPSKDSLKMEDFKNLPHSKTESLLNSPKLKDNKSISQTKEKTVVKRKEKHETPAVKKDTSRNSQVSNSGRNSLTRNKEPTTEKNSEQPAKSPPKSTVDLINCQKSKVHTKLKQVCQKPIYNNLTNQLVEDCCQRSSILKKPRADCLCCDSNQSKENEMSNNVDQRTLTVECCQIDKSQIDITVNSQCNSTQETNNQDADKVKCVEFECRILETDNKPQDCDYKDQCPCCYASLQRHICADICANAFAEGELRKCVSCLCIQNCDGCDQSCPCSKRTSRRDITSCDNVETCTEESSSCDMETSCTTNQDCECLEQKCDEDDKSHPEDNNCCCDEVDSRDNLICCCDVSNDNLHHTLHSCEEDNADDLYCRCDQEAFVNNNQINDQFCCCDDQQQIDNDISVEVEGHCGKGMKKQKVEEILDNTSNIVLCLCDDNRSKPVKICYAGNAPNTSYDTVTYCCQNTKDTRVSETCCVDDCSCNESADEQDAADICQESESCECCDDGLTEESDGTLTCCCKAEGNEESQPKEPTFNCCCSHTDNSLIVCSCDTKRKGTICHSKELYDPTIVSKSYQCYHCKPDLNSMQVQNVSCESYENICQKYCRNLNTTSNAKYCKKTSHQKNFCTCYDECSNREAKRGLRRCEPNPENRKMHSCPPKLCDIANWEIPQARYIECCDTDQEKQLFTKYQVYGQKSWADEVPSNSCAEVDQHAKDSKCNKAKEQKDSRRHSERNGSQSRNTNGKEKTNQPKSKSSNDKAASSHAVERDEKRDKLSNRATNQSRTSPPKLVTSTRDRKSIANETKQDITDKTAGSKNNQRDSRNKSKMVEDKNTNAKTSGKKFDEPVPTEEMNDNIVENVNTSMEGEDESNEFNSIEDETPVVYEPPRTADKQRVSQETPHKRAGSGGKSNAERSKGNCERHSRTVVRHISECYLNPNCKQCPEQKCKFVHQSRRPSPSPRGRTNNFSANNTGHQKPHCEAGNPKTLRRPVIQTTNCSNGHISRSPCTNNHKREACTSKQSTCKTNRLRAGSSDRNSPSREQCSSDNVQDESVDRNIPHILDRILQDKKKLEQQQRILTSMDFQDSISDVSHEEITNINHLYSCDDEAMGNVKILETQKHITKSKIPRLILPKIYQVYRESHEISTSRKQQDEFSKHPQKYSTRRELRQGRPENTTRQSQKNSECCKCLREHCCASKKSRIPQPSRTIAAKNSKVAQVPRLSYELVAYDPKSNTDDGSLTCMVCHKYLRKSASGQVMASTAELLDSEESLRTRPANYRKPSGKVQETVNISQVKHCNSSGCLIKNVSQVTAKTNRRLTPNSPQGSENFLASCISEHNTYSNRIEKFRDRQIQTHVLEEKQQGNYGPRGLCLYCQRNAEIQANRERRLSIANLKPEDKDRSRGCSAVRTGSSHTVSTSKRTAGVADESLNHVLKSLAAACIKCVKDTEKVKCHHKTERQTMTDFPSSSIGNKTDTNHDKPLKPIAICSEFQDSDSEPQNDRTCKPNELYCYPSGRRDDSPNIPTSNFILQEKECSRIRGGLTDNLGREKKVKSDTDVRIYGCSCMATIPKTAFNNCGPSKIISTTKKGGFNNNGKCCCNLRVDNDNRSYHAQSPTPGSKSYSESYVEESSECRINSVPVELTVLVTECCEEQQECKSCKEKYCCEEKDAKETTNEQLETENPAEIEITKPRNNTKSNEEKHKQASGSKNTDQPKRSSTTPSKDPSVERKASVGNTLKKDSAAKTPDTPTGLKTIPTKTKETQKEMERRKTVDSQNATERKPKQMKSTGDSPTVVKELVKNGDPADDLNTFATVVDDQSESCLKEVICCQESTRCSNICPQIPLQVYRCMCGRTIPCPYRQMLNLTENPEDDESKNNPISTNDKEPNGKSDDKKVKPLQSPANSKPPNDRKAPKDTSNSQEDAKKQTPNTKEVKARDKNITETVSSRKARSETQLSDRTPKHPKDIKRDSSVKTSNQQKTAAPNVTQEKSKIDKNNKTKREKTNKEETEKNKLNASQPTTKAAAKDSTKLEAKQSATTTSPAKPKTTSIEQPAQSKTQPKKKDHIHDAEELPHLDPENVNISGSCDVMVVTKRTHLYKSNGAEKIEEKRLVITKPTAAELESGSGVQLPDSDVDVIKRCKRIGDKLCKITITKENRAKKRSSEEKS